jgi:hypothetical protein
MVQKHLALFELLVQSQDRQRSALLKTLTDTQLKALLEAIYNVLKGTCPINDKDKKKLNRHKNVIRRLVSSTLTQKQRQRVLIKYRYILSTLLKPVVEMLKSI